MNFDQIDSAYREENGNSYKGNNNSDVTTF
jgi:hypothetical protein